MTAMDRGRRCGYHVLLFIEIGQVCAIRLSTVIVIFFYQIKRCNLEDDVGKADGMALLVSDRSSDSKAGLGSVGRRSIGCRVLDNHVIWELFLLYI